MRFRTLLCWWGVSLAGTAPAQDRAIGQWRSHYPYTSVSSVATDGQTLYAAAGAGFFSYNAASGEIVTHSKVDGMTDAGTDQIAYDTTTKTVVLSYLNGNIDLFRNGSFYNIPDLRLKSLSGSKQIADIHAVNGRAYLSTSFGIIVLDLTREEVAETYEFTLAGQSLAVTALRPYGPFLYATTPRGLYRAPAASRTLQAFSTWQRVGTVDSLTSLAVADGSLWTGGNRGVFRLNAAATTLDTIFRSRSVVHVDPAPAGLLVSEFYTGGPAFFGRVKVLNSQGAFVDSFGAGQPNNAVYLADKSYWCADGYEGLTKPAPNFRFQAVRPSGPNDVLSYDIQASNGTVRVAHGAYSAQFVPRDFTGGLSTLRPDGRWEIVGGIPDAVGVLADADGTTYVASLRNGLVVLKPGEPLANVNEGVLEPASYDASRYPAIALAKDQGGNLLVGQYQARAHELAVRTPAGTWTSYVAAGSSTAGGATHTAAGLLVDDFNQKWWFQPQGGGIFVYDDARTPENTADDRSIHLTAGAGSGNLPSAFVLSMARDRDGAIWVGTENGIGIYSCAGSILQTPCDAELRVVQFDQFAGKLFENERVQTIAVDGANRKWIGTNNGVWLLSPDAQRIIERFTTDNSPLPANIIQKISVDDVTGDVYIGTTNGLMSYRGTATAGTETAGDVKTFPNPVPSGYGGTIAIRGLTTDADVRITDISGQLIYRTTALGGQAVWNGLDYTGKRPQSGVYLVLVTNKDGSQTAQGKLVFLE